MTDDLAERYAADLHATVGHEGRMIGFSKSLYRENHPGQAPIFNANVCIAAGKIWHGDLDLTVDEPILSALSARIGEIVYVLYEPHGRFEHEADPLLDQAVYSVTPSGHTRFQHEWYERARDGSLRRRPPEPDTRARWHWRILLHRPRLLRFWQLEHETNSSWQDRTGVTYRLLYVGSRDGGRTPLLVFQFESARSLRRIGLEAIWYPAVRQGRSAGRPLLHLPLRLRLGPLRIWFSLTV